MADNGQRQTHGDMLNDLMQEEFKAWANVHDDLTPEQLSRLESAYKETGEIQDIELAYSEMRRKGETQQSDFRDWVEAHPDLSAEDITRLHGIYQQTHDTSDLDLSYSVTHGNKEEAAKEQTGTEDNVQPATNNGNDGENNNQPNNDANTNQAGSEQEANTPSNGQPQEIMTVEQAVRLANGDLNSLTFDQIEEMYAVLEGAEAADNSPEANALNRLRGFSEAKTEEASAEDFVIDAENAAELDAWLRINDESKENQDQAPRNKILHDKINGFYKQYDEENKITEITSASRETVEENFNTLEEILQSYDPLARDENGELLDKRFAKVEEFYDEMQIDNSDKNVDFVSNVYLKRDMTDLAVHEAQTELMKDPEFAKLSAEEKQEALAKAVLGKMQEGITSIISTEMGQSFLLENAALIDKLKDENLPAEERAKLLAEFEQKSADYKKSLDARLQQQTDYMAEDPVQLTDKQKEYLGKIYAHNNQEFNQETTWNELSEQDKEILVKGAESLKELALTESQKASDKAPVKPAPFKAKAANLGAVLHDRSNNLKNLNKRLAQKTGFMKMWQKVKDFDQRLMKSHPKMWGFAKNFALSTAVSMTTGGVGLAVLAAYKANKVLRVVDKKAKANNMGFFTYLKKNKTEAIALGTAVAGAMISTAFAGADVMAHGISSAGLVGQAVDHTIHNGGNIIDGVTQMATNIHGNASAISAADITEKVKNIDSATLWDGFKKAVTNPKTALRAGLAFTSGTAAAMVNLAHGDKKKAKEAFWGGLLGASMGLAAAEAAHVLGEHAPAPDNSVDGVTGAAPVTPPHAPEDVTPSPEPTPEPAHPAPEQPTPAPDPAPEHPKTEAEETSPELKEQDSKDNTPKVSSPEFKERGDGGVDLDVIQESDKALYEEFLKRRSIGCDDPALAEKMAHNDLDKFTEFMEKGDEKAATDYARQVYNATEQREGEIARTLDGDDDRKISIAKAKANSAYNAYHEKQLELQRMDPNDPDYEKTARASDKALRKYTDSMVKLSQKELSAQIDRMEQDGMPKEQIEAMQAELKVLKKGDYNAAKVDEVVNDRVAGVGDMYSDKSFSKALLTNISLRNQGR